jgi:hypothetical protein
VVVMGKGLYDVILHEGFTLSNRVGAFPLIYMDCPVTCNARLRSRLCCYWQCVSCKFCAYKYCQLFCSYKYLCLQIIVPDLSCASTVRSQGNFAHSLSLSVSFSLSLCLFLSLSLSISLSLSLSLPIYLFISLSVFLFFEQVDWNLPALWFCVRMHRGGPLFSMLSERDSKGLHDVEQAFRTSLGR